MLTTQNTPALVSNPRRGGQEQAPMKVKILRNTVANRQPVEVGQIVELTKQEAEYLILRKLAEVAVDPVIAAQPAPVIETADLKPAFETADKPRAKRKE